MALRQIFRKFQGPLRQCYQSSTTSNPGSFLDISIDDKTGISTVSFQKPPVNSLNLELLKEFNKVLVDLETNRTRGLVLTSTLKSIFTAGLDIRELYKPDEERCRDFWTEFQDSWINLYGSSFPTVAIINGHSPAGGCVLAMSCEYRVMLPNYKIGLNETQLGIVAPYWCIETMQNIIGTRHSEKILTSGTLCSTDEALKIGLVDEIANDETDAKIRALVFLQRFAKISPQARALTKQSLRGKILQDLIEHRKADTEQFLSFLMQDEVQLGLEQYLKTMKKK